MKSNDKLVDYLRKTERIKTDKVEKAFRKVDRKIFVPEKYRSNAYNDRPLPLDGEATISAPHMVAINTELLEPEEDNRVLEIGSGSGYQLAVLAELCQEAVGVEIVEEIAEKSRENLENWENTRVITGSGIEAAEGEFDKILFSCAIDKEKFEQACERVGDGVVVAPVDNGRQILKRYINGEVESHGSVRFVEYKD